MELRVNQNLFQPLPIYLPSPSNWHRLGPGWIPGVVRSTPKLLIQRFCRLERLLRYLLAIHGRWASICTYLLRRGHEERDKLPMPSGIQTKQITSTSTFNIDNEVRPLSTFTAMRTICTDEEDIHGLSVGRKFEVRISESSGRHYYVLNQNVQLLSIQRCGIFHRVFLYLLQYTGFSSS